MYSSPFSYNSKGGFSRVMQSPGLNQSPARSNRISPYSKDRFVSPAKSPSRSPLRQGTNSIVDACANKRQSTPTTPKSRKAPIAEDSILDAPNVQQCLPLKLIDFNSHGDLAVALGNSIYIWSQGQVNVLLESKGTKFDSVCWCDEGLILSGSGHSELWDVRRQSAIKEFVDHENRCCAISTCGELVATGGDDGRIYVTDLRSSDSRSIGAYRKYGEVSGLAWSYDGRFLAAGFNGVVAVVDKDVYQTAGRVQALSWTQSDILYAADYDQGVIQMIRATMGQVVHEVDTEAPISGLCYTDSWGLVSSSSFRGEWSIYSPRNLELIKEYSGHTSGVINITTCEEKNLIATIGMDETLRIWNLREQCPQASPSVRRPPSPFGNFGIR